MSELFDRLVRAAPHALPAMHVMEHPNEPITIYGGPVQLGGGSNEAHDAVGTIELAWQPWPRLAFRGRGALGPRFMFTGQPLRFEVERLAVSTELRLDRAGLFEFDEVGKTPLSGHIVSDAWAGSDEPVERLTFPLPNFHSFTGQITKSPGDAGPRIALNRLYLQGGGWALTIDQLPECAQLDQEAARVRGFALGHTCELKKTGGEPITRAEAADVADATFNFLSFCRGFWSGPLLLSGESQGRRVWTRWFVPKLTPRRGVHSWFPDQPAMVRTCFDGFMQAWGSEPGPGRDLCWNAVHWYVEANIGSGAVEGALILSQTALELLGWICLVEEGDVSRNEFGKRLGGTERVTRLIDWAKLSDEVPAPLEDVAERLGADSGPELLKRVRDALVHPKPTRRERLRQLTVGERSLIRDLSNHYVELVLLKRFGYRGPYRNRMNGGEVELTPWGGAPGDDPLSAPGAAPP